MSTVVQIELPPQTIRFIENFKAAPEAFGRAITRAMDRALQVVSGRIQKKRLTGRGPFPVEQHRLGERTGQLKLRTRATKSVLVKRGNEVEVTGAIGSSVFYASFHEFGTRRTPKRAPFTTEINEN